ncbi:MAG: DUF424 domain-containing protein [archaeon]|jgi:hypothetical protein|nr:hypothetical protein [Euryarchaeota archaeon]MDP6704329.1 DUF424 domain-containing protein [archaeon]MDP7260576.1 DUF424 domain-containing protein [archaeon]HIK01387.1 DUF424 domain-containing protein [Candidatus Undinarchaeales archaeon ERR594346 U_76725]|tara:strand:+ start:4474 stop:4767 length:294 start_codon:yes stop_codon:yes gene_type:complete
MICARIISSDAGSILAACDKELLGKTFSEGDISLTVDENFYGNEEVDAETFKEMLKSSGIANLVGENCVSIAIELGLVTEKTVLKIEGIPHAQILNL